MIIVNDSLLVKCRSTLLIEMIKFQDIGLFFGSNIAVIDLPNPTRSDGNNLLHLVTSTWMNTAATNTTAPPRPRRRSTPG